VAFRAVRGLTASYEVGKGIPRKKRRHAPDREMLERDEQQDQQETTILPTIQAAEGDSIQPDPCNIPYGFLVPARWKPRGNLPCGVANN
jgi:hypothetical protein